MPALCVSVDGQPVATVAFDDNTLITISLFGNRSHDEFAVLGMHGGCYGAGQPTRHLIWIAERRIEPGQVVEVAYVADAPTSHKGMTIDEAYPDEPATEVAGTGVAQSDKAGKTDKTEKSDFTITEAMFEALRARPLLRDGYAFELAPSAGAVVSGRTENDEISFGLNIMWAALHRPDSVRYSLGTNTLDNVHTRAPARAHAQSWLQTGNTLRFQVWVATCP